MVSLSPAGPDWNTNPQDALHKAACFTRLHDLENYRAHYELIKGFVWAVLS